MMSTSIEQAKIDSSYDKGFLAGRKSMRRAIRQVTKEIRTHKFTALSATRVRSLVGWFARQVDAAAKA